MATNFNGDSSIMSRILVDQIRSNSASADAMTLDGSGNVTFPANATCSGTATGFGGGKIKQYKYVQSSTTYQTTSTSFQDLSSPFSVAITPTSASNLLLCRLAVQINVYETSGVDANGVIAITDDGASSYLMEAEFRGYDYGGNGMYLNNPFCSEHVKVAGNTNARTYSLRMRMVTGDKILINNYSTSANRNSVLSVMEIEP